MPCCGRPGPARRDRLAIPPARQRRTECGRSRQTVPRRPQARSRAPAGLSYHPLGGPPAAGPSISPTRHRIWSRPSAGLSPPSHPATARRRTRRAGVRWCGPGAPNRPRSWPRRRSGCTEHGRRMFAELREGVRQIALLHGPSIDGFTDFTTHGAVFVNASRLTTGRTGLPGWVRLADALVHEGTHTRCNAAALSTPFLVPGTGTGTAPTMTTPLRADPRPLTGLFQQTVVLARQVGLDRLLYEEAPAHLPPKAVAARRTQVLDRARQGAETLRRYRASLTPAGEAVRTEVDELRRGRACRRVRTPARPGAAGDGLRIDGPLDARGLRPLAALPRRAACPRRGPLRSLRRHGRSRRCPRPDRQCGGSRPRRRTGRARGELMERMGNVLAGRSAEAEAARARPGATPGIGEFVHIGDWCALRRHGVPAVDPAAWSGRDDSRDVRQLWCRGRSTGTGEEVWVPPVRRSSSTVRRRAVRSRIARGRPAWPRIRIRPRRLRTRPGRSWNAIWSAAAGAPLRTSGRRCPSIPRAALPADADADVVRKLLDREAPARPSCWRCRRWQESWRSPLACTIRTAPIRPSAHAAHRPARVGTPSCGPAGRRRRSVGARRPVARRGGTDCAHRGPAGADWTTRCGRTTLRMRSPHWTGSRAPVHSPDPAVPSPGSTRSPVSRPLPSPSPTALLADHTGEDVIAVERSGGATRR